MDGYLRKIATLDMENEMCREEFARIIGDLELAGYLIVNVNEDCVEVVKHKKLG